MSVRSGYKQTELGQIPEEWEVVKLQDVSIRFVSGGTPSTSNVKYWNGDIPWMRSAWISSMFVDSGEGLISEDGLRNSSTNLVPKKNILIATRVSLGNVVINRVDMAISQDLTGIILDKKRCAVDYVYWTLRNSEREIKRLAQGSTIKGVLREDLARLKIGLPPMLEQQQIASILSTIDNCIQKSDQIIAKTQQLKTGLIQQLFTQGIGHTRFKQTEIGEIPEEWRISLLDDILLICQYGLNDPLFENGRYPILRMNNLENGYVVVEDTKFANISDEVFNMFKLKKGDILLNRTNSYDLVGKVGVFLLSDNYTFASYLIRLQVDPERADPLFVNFCLNATPFQNRLKSLATRGSSQANINATSLKSIQIPLPCLEEQHKIASILLSLDEKIEKDMQKRIQLEFLKKGLMNDLLTGKVRVKVT